MKYALTIIACLLPIGATPALAAPQWVEDTCFKQAQLVRPALRADEQEAFIANCIANYTPAPQTKRRKSKKPRY